MRKLWLIGAFFLALAGWSAPASAQCVSVGGSSGPAPLPGMSCLSDPTILTYSASSIGLQPAASATDIACIQGAASTVIRLNSIAVSGTAATQIVVPVILMKRASLDTGGTPATGNALPAAAKHDSNNAAAAATFNAWTANPTVVDSSPGIIGVGNLNLSKTDGTNGLGAPMTIFDYSEANYSQKPILRTAAQAICVNLNATSPSTGAVNIWFRWTEATQ